MLGGIKTPRVPPAAIHPVANLAEYPLFLISGIPIVPIAAHVAGLDPLKAAKIEQAPIFETTDRQAISRAICLNLCTNLFQLVNLQQPFPSK